MGWHLVTRGNIQQISYIPLTEQHLPFGLMLLRLGNVTIMCVCVCVHECVCVHLMDTSKNLQETYWISRRGGRTWSCDCDNQLTFQGPETSYKNGSMDTCNGCMKFSAILKMHGS